MLLVGILVCLFIICAITIYLMNNGKSFTQIERVLFAVLMSVSLTVVVGLFILLCFALNEALVLLA